MANDEGLKPEGAKAGEDALRMGFIETGILARVIAGLFLALPISLALFLGEIESRTHFAFVVDTWAQDGATVQLYFDRGFGLIEPDSRRVSIAPGECPQNVSGRCETIVHSFALPQGRYTAFHIAFRIDPDIQGARFFLRNPRVVDADGQVLRSFSENPFVANGQVAALKSIDDGVEVSVPSGALDPAVELVFRNQPLRLTIWSSALILQTLLTSLIVAAGRIAIAAAGSIALVLALSTLVARVHVEESWSAWLRRPQIYLGLILGLGVIAVGLSTYPVVFFGRSYTAPQLGGVPLVYPVPPYVPGGVRDVPNEYVRYADVHAFSLAFRPWSVIEARAVLDDGEFPLWNRYNQSGLPLLGQGISQIADPLHWLVMFGWGSALAWDTNFLLAKALFVIGNALVAFFCVRSLPLSLLVGGSSAFIGFFLFKINHGAYFTLSYAPWLLLAWICLVTTGRRWVAIASISLLIVSTFGILVSGALKEGLAMSLGIDAAGLIMLISARVPALVTVRRLTILALTAVAIILLSFPVWSSFLTTLKDSVTFYDAPAVHVLPLSMLGGLLDDIFYLRIALQRFPSLNLFLGVGILWGIVSFRRFARDRHYVGLLVGAALSALLAYGVIPPSVVAKVPFIGNIDHVHDAFAGPIIVIGVALAAYGFRAMTEFGDARLWWRRHWIVSGLLVLLVASSALVPIDPARIGFEPLPDLQDLGIWGFLAVMVLYALTVAPLLRRVTETGARNSLAVVALILCILVLHIRDGMHIETGIEGVDHYMLNPGPRPDFSVPSRALASLPSPEGDPYRIVGLGYTLAPGYSGAVGLESINGPDALIPATYRNLLLALHFPFFERWRLQISAADVAPLAGALDFLNVRYLARMPGAATALPSLSAVIRKDLDILARPTAWPRAYFTDDVRTYRSIEELAQFIQESGGKPFAALAAADASRVLALLAPDHERRGTVAAHDYRLTSNSTHFKVDVLGPGIIILGEQYFDGFDATVNGVEQPILRINGVFKGVAVAHAGTYDVVFTFNPRYWQLTPYVAGIGAFILVIALTVVYWLMPSQADPRSMAVGRAGQ